MPKFQLTPDFPETVPARIVLDDGTVVAPGQVVECDVNPDPSFFDAVDEAPAPADVEAEPVTVAPESEQA